MKIQFAPAPKPSQIALSDWQSWGWQLRNAYRTQEQFQSQFDLAEDEQKVFTAGDQVFNIRCTPYYAGLVGKDVNDPIRKILMPNAQELSFGSQALLDPLGERKNNPVPRIIHRYPDRVLFLVTDICSVYCRYCTRKHFTGQEQAFIKVDEFARAIDYITKHPGIREVILSGGDPLTLSNSQLRKVLTALRAIEHVEIIRLGTRMPVVCPMRVDQELVTMLREFKPVYLMTHFNHPRELTAESAQALELFVDHGVPVFNQMVLLNGVNNHPAIVQALSRRLLYLRVKPYYMFQCDPSEGTDHLRTSVENSMEIQRELWGVMSGLAMPTLSLDIPDGGGKASLVPEFEVSRAAGERHYKGWDGVQAVYKNPEHPMLVPTDVDLYMPEWEQTKNAKSSPGKSLRSSADIAAAPIDASVL